jgi:hypothetical protein
MSPLTPDEQSDLIEIAGSGVFDEAWYCDAYPDVAACPLDPLVHFIRYGWREARDPGPLFSVQHYLAVHPDVAAAGANPLAHYLACGWREGRSPRPGFDARAYVARVGLPDDVCPLVHEAAQRRPGPA